MKAKWIGVVTKRTLATVYGLAVVLVISLPCSAQQPNVEQLKATTASLTADSAKRGENASFQACQTNGAYGLCITFPGADASDLAQRIYTDVNFAKEMAHQGFVTVLIRNTTTDKKLSQDYAMNVSEQGWAANDNYIHDAAEYIAVILAENQHDPSKKVIALKAYLQRYPNSVVKKPILQRLLIALGQTGDREGSIATAKELLAIVDASDPERVHSLWVLVYNGMLEANAGTNTDQNLKEAKEYSEIGMQALEQIKKPEPMTDEQFASLKSNASAAFKGAISADEARSATVSESSALMNSLAQQTIEVVSSQRGPRNTWMLSARSTTSNITMVLFCSNDIYYGDYSGHRACEGISGTFLAKLLPAKAPFTYEHYATWTVQKMDPRYTGDDASWVFALYKVRDSQGNVHEGRYPGTKAQFVDNGVALDMDQPDQSQDKTDEQAACLEFIQKRDSTEYRRPDYLPVPKVDCYDHITYTHVKLTKPAEGSASVRGIILHDDRPSSCGSKGCAVYLAIQGCDDYPGQEESCRNSWSRGIVASGADMKISTVIHGGWYDVLLTRTASHAGSSVQPSTYRYVGRSRYQDIVVTAREEQKARERAEERRSIALSLGLRSDQSQAQVKAILAAHGYSRLEDGTGQTGPWNCSSSGWKGGQWTTSCISQKGDVKVMLYFELGRMRRDGDTGALQQVRTDRLLFASFEFEKYEFPDNTLKFLSPTLKKCHGEDDGDGVCFNF